MSGQKNKLDEPIYKFRYRTVEWQNRKETATCANGEVRDSSEATAVTPTLTRRN